MYGDVITLGPEILQRHLLHPPALRHLWRSNGVITNSLAEKKSDTLIHCHCTRDNILRKTFNRNKT